MKKTKINNEVSTSFDLKKEKITQITKNILKEENINLPIKEFVRLVKETPLDNGMVDLEFEILNPVVFDKIKKIIEENGMTIEEFFVECLTSFVEKEKNNLNIK